MPLLRNDKSFIEQDSKVIFHNFDIEIIETNEGTTNV